MLAGRECVSCELGDIGRAVREFWALMNPPPPSLMTLLDAALMLLLLLLLASASASALASALA